MMKSKYFSTKEEALHFFNALTHKYKHVKGFHCTTGGKIGTNMYVVEWRFD